MSVESMIQVARGWRGLDGLVVTIVQGDKDVDLAVQLGKSRGRWKRVAAALASAEVVAAKGFAKQALIGTWELPDEPDPDDEESGVSSPETPWQVSHRAHTRWCLEYAAKMNSDNQRLTTELVGAVIEFVRDARASIVRGGGASEVPSSEDETARTLQMLLGTVMASKGGNDGEAQRQSERTQGDARGPGPQGESDGAGT